MIRKFYSPQSGTPSSSSQITTVCAKELRGEAGCKELCDECKRKMQEELKEFDSYLTETRNSFVKAITEVYPHEERLDDYARSTIRVAAEDILIAFDQLRDRFIGGNEGWTRVEGLVKSDPISFFMTNIMRYMNEEQIKILIEKLILRAPPTVTKSVETENAGLGVCVECKKRNAVRDYNGHKHYVCEPCYKSLDSEFEDEYR
jgi:hypothetical protein